MPPANGPAIFEKTIILTTMDAWSITHPMPAPHTCRNSASSSAIYHPAQPRCETTFTSWKGRFPMIRLGRIPRKTRFVALVDPFRIASSPEFAPYPEKLTLTDRQLFAFSLSESAVFFSRAFLSFSTLQSLENQRQTRLIAYTGSVNIFRRDDVWSHRALVTEVVDKFSPTAKIRKVFYR